MIGAKLRRRSDLLLGWTGRCAAVFNAGERLAHHINPSCIGGGARNQRTPNGGGLGTVAILLGREAEEITGRDVLAVERGRPFERRLCLRRHDAVGGEHDRLAERRFARRGPVVEPKRVAPGLDGILETPEPQVHRCDHFPAAAIVGIALEMRLDPGDERFHGGIARRSQPGREWLIRQRGRAEREIDCGRRQRHDQNRYYRDRSAAPRRRSRHSPLPRSGWRERLRVGRSD